MLGIRQVAAAVPLFCVLGCVARAESVEAGWDTYFYSEPHYSARVLDEVQRRAKLDVISCADGWCRVRYGDAVGHVHEDVVHGQRDTVERAKVAADPVCFHAAQPGGNAWQDEKFCRMR